VGVYPLDEKLFTVDVELTVTHFAQCASCTLTEKGDEEKERERGERKKKRSTGAAHLSV
jgi:hypothetical protein